MRKLIFRVWDTDNKVMIRPDDYDYQIVIRGNSIKTEYLEDISPCQWVDVNSEIMQFTGMKDKNEVDIYEGDILDYGNGRVFYVSYVGVQFMATFNDRVVNSSLPIHLFYIIGNIYENPELINH